MREEIQARLEELKKELESGQAELQKVEMQRTYLHETVLRIGGAIQVLEELLREGQSAKQNTAAAAPSEKGQRPAEQNPDSSPGPHIPTMVHEGSTTNT
jgi:chromosome segregation ATPase